MPSLFSFLSARNPSIDLSKINALMPRLPFSLSVTATATQVWQAMACVIKFFEPFTFHPPLLRTAFVRVPAESDPACDSVNPQAPKLSPCARGTRYFCFCSSLPNIYMWLEHKELCAATERPTEPSTRAISSMMVAYSTYPIPAPPYSSGKRTPIRPNSARCGLSSSGKCCDLVPFHYMRADLALGKFAHAVFYLFLLFV